MDKENSFEYTYSAPEQEELRRIREKYTPKQERQAKLDQLRELDRSVTASGTVASLVLGTVSCLVMGIGMCCCLVWTQYFILGIVVGVLGIIGMSLAYPVYKTVCERRKAAVTPQILKLTEDLMQ